MSFAVVATVAAIGASVATGYLAVALAVTSVAASMAAQRRQKKEAKRAAEKAADAAKGFQVTQEASASPLPIVYGRAALGGIRVFANTYSSYVFAETPGAIVFNQNLGFTRGGKKHEYLIQQIALSVNPLHNVIMVEVNEEDSQDDKFSFGQRIVIHKKGGVPCPLMVANDSSRTNSKFSMCSFATGVFRLDRDDPQYQGIPSLKFFVEGAEVHDVVLTGETYSLSETRVYSNNPALCLLDYLTNPVYGRGLDLQFMDLESFYRAKLYCDEVVMTAPLDGKFWERRGNREVKRFELNIALDSDTEFRENISIILNSMNDASLLWVGNKYVLAMTYPKTSATINRFDIRQFTDGSEKSLFMLTGIDDTAPTSDTNNWQRVDIPIDDNDLQLEEPLALSWPSAQSRLNHVKVTYLNDAKSFKEDSVAWPDKLGRLDGPNKNRGAWISEGSYNYSDIVSFDSFEYQLQTGLNYTSMLTPAQDSNWARLNENSVYATFRREDNELLLEETEDTPFLSNYYSARNYAEQRVRLSRTQVSGKLKLRLQHWKLLPGDYVNITSELYGIQNQLVKLTKVSYNSAGFVECDFNTFDAAQLSWNAPDDEAVPTQISFQFQLEQATNLRFEVANSALNLSPLRLLWDAANDNRVNEYLIRAAQGTLTDVQNNLVTWFDVGRTTDTYYDLPSLYSNDFVFTVISTDGTRKAPRAGWPLLFIPAQYFEPSGVNTIQLSIFKSDGAITPATPTGGSYNFETNSASVPVNWGLSVPQGPYIYVSYAIARDTEISRIVNLTWSTPQLYLLRPVTVRAEPLDLFVSADLENNPVDYSNAIGSAKYLIDAQDFTALSGTTFSVANPVNCVANISNNNNEITNTAGVTSSAPGRVKGSFAVTNITANSGSFEVTATRSGISRSVIIYVRKLQSLVSVTDLTPPPKAPQPVLSAGFMRVSVSSPWPTYTEGRGNKLTRIYGYSVAYDDVSPRNFNNATLLGTLLEGTSLLQFPSEPLKKWHIWLQYVSKDNVEGPLSDPQGVVTDVEPGLLIDALTNKIGNDQLASAVRNVLELVTASETVNGSVSQRISQATESFSDDIGNLYSRIAFKVDVAGHVSGFGLASTGNSEGVTSAFGIRADQFFVAPPAVNSASAPTNNLFKGFVWVDTSVTPNVTKYWTGTAWSTSPQNYLLTVQTTPTVLNGMTVAPGVYIDELVVRNGSITNLKIANLAVDDQKVLNLSAEKLSVGDGTVGGNLKSVNFDAVNNTGWQIERTGLATFNEVVIRGPIFATQGTIGGSFIGATYVQSLNWVNLQSGWRLNNDGTGQIGGIAFLSDRLRSGNFVDNQSGFEITSGGGIKAFANNGGVRFNTTATGSESVLKVGESLDLKANGDAIFKGTLDVSSALTGARMEIKNNVIKVFDAAGVLRVQIGDLTA